MSGEAIATYERSFLGKWTLAVYYGSIPKKSVNGSGPDQMGKFVVPLECYVDGKPDLTLISARFSTADAGIRDDIESSNT